MKWRIHSNGRCGDAVSEPKHKEPKVWSPTQIKSRGNLYATLDRNKFSVNLHTNETTTRATKGSQPSNQWQKSRYEPPRKKPRRTCESRADSHHKYSHGGDRSQTMSHSSVEDKLMSKERERTEMNTVSKLNHTNSRCTNTHVNLRTWISAEGEGGGREAEGGEKRTGSRPMTARVTCIIGSFGLGGPSGFLRPRASNRRKKKRGGGGHPCSTQGNVALTVSLYIFLRAPDT